MSVETLGPTPTMEVGVDVAADAYVVVAVKVFEGVYGVVPKVDPLKGSCEDVGVTWPSAGEGAARSANSRR